MFQTLNLLMQALTMAAHVISGTRTADTSLVFAVIAPAMLIPVLIGPRIYRRFSNAGFRRAVLLLLTASA